MGQLEDMAMFARIVEAGSMSRAAEQTGIARSAVSRRLAALEQSLNTQLLVRNTRNSTLTDAGSSFYERAKQILADVQELNSETSGSQTQLDGDLRIAAPVSFGLLHLSGVVNEFADKYPALSLHQDRPDRPPAPRLRHMCYAERRCSWSNPTARRHEAAARPRRCAARATCP